MQATSRMASTADEDTNEVMSGLSMDIVSKVAQPRRGVILANQSTIFKQMIALRKRKNENDYCTYLHRICMQPKVDGFAYCNRHILQDKNAPFKQCSFQHLLTLRRCPFSARKLDRHDSKVFCEEHSNVRPVNKVLDNYKQQFLISTITKPNNHVESLKRSFEELEHYCLNTSHSHSSSKPEWYVKEDKSVGFRRKFLEKRLEAFAQVLYGEDGSNGPDVTKLTVGDVTQTEDFERDTTFCYANDPLRNSGFISVGDLERTMQDKLFKLVRLHHSLSLLRTEIVNTGTEVSARIEYNLAHPDDGSDPKKPVEPVMVGMFTYFNDTPNDGAIEPVPETKLSFKTIFHTCVYHKGSERCSNPTLRTSRYCKQHILYDLSQVLFRPCADGPLSSDTVCLEPVVPYTLRSTCSKHTRLKYSVEDIENILKSSLSGEAEECSNTPDDKSTNNGDDETRHDAEIDAQEEQKMECDDDQQQQLKEEQEDAALEESSISMSL